MDLSIVIKIAAVGIVVAVLNAILVRSGRDDYALITILAGITINCSLSLSFSSTAFPT